MYVWNEGLQGENLFPHINLCIDEFSVQRKAPGLKSHEENRQTIMWNLMKIRSV